jgi:hypothetical protein
VGPGVRAGFGVYVPNLDLFRSLKSSTTGTAYSGTAVPAKLGMAEMPDQAHPSKHCLLCITAIARQ